MVPSKYRALSAAIDRDIEREGLMSSTMVRAGLIRDLLDDLAAKSEDAGEYVMVPREPTVEMLLAGDPYTHEYARDAWSAMLAASPPPPTETVEPALGREDYTDGPTYQDENGGHWVAEIQTTGGYEVAAEVYGGTYEDATQLRDAIIALLGRGK